MSRNKTHKTFYVFGIFRKAEGLIFNALRSLLIALGLKNIPGVDHLAEFIYKLHNAMALILYSKFRPKGIILTEVEGNKLYIDADDLGISRVILNEGAWEKYQTELFKSALEVDMTVVDIGALFGHYTLIAADIIGQGGTVYAFEPVPKHCDLLSKNIKENGYTNVQTIQKVISNRSGVAEIWVDKYNIASAGISDKNTLPLFDSNLSSKMPVKAKTTTLDEFFKDKPEKDQPDLIKMDVAGAEGLVIAGADRTLKRKHLKIFMELWPEGLKGLGTEPLQLLQQLKDYGFRINLINEEDQQISEIEPVKFCKALESMKGHQEFNLFLEK